MITSLTYHHQDLRKLIFEAPFVGAHSRAPLLYMVFVRKSWPQQDCLSSKSDRIYGKLSALVIGYTISPTSKADRVWHWVEVR